MGRLARLFSANSKPTVDMSPQSAAKALDMQPREFAAIAANAVSEEWNRLLGTRFGAGSQYDGLRKIEEVCGYKTDLTWDDYWQTYDRFELAGRIVEAYPQACFTRPPKIVEKLNGDDTPFEKEMNAILSGKFNAAGYLQRLDILAGIGQYAILLIGVDDGASLETPMSTTRKNKITYFRPFKQGDLAISEWDINKNSPRFGQPIYYKTRLAQPLQITGTMAGASATQFTEQEIRIHYTRVLHFADNLLENDVFGTSRLHRVYNRLADILKVVSGSAEMFWRGAYQGLAFEMDAEAQLDDATRNTMKDNIENYLRGLTRQLLLQGTKAKSLAPNIASPMEHFDVGMTMIAVAAKMPKRILMGTEQGKLASTQDLHTWNRSVEERRYNVAQPRLVMKLADWCILYKVVAPPAQGEYHVEWAPLTIPDESENAKIAVQYTDALAKYVAGKTYYLMTFDVYLREIWGFSQRKSEELAKGINYEELKKLDVKPQESADRDTTQEYEDRNASKPKGGV